jgi:rSAM/selenodomain-associated transferase 1
MLRTHSAKRVVVFAKAPRPGSVKTRLIPLLGPEGAAALHARFIKQTLAKASVAARGAVELHGDCVADDFLQFCAARYDVALAQQRGRDLGKRMQHAFEHAFSQGCRSMLLIGTDCPVLTARHLRAALRVLDEHEAVFVPTEDGGYALIGLRRCDAHLFEKIAWSTQSVMEDSRIRLRELGWRWTELETLWDVDRPQDYLRLIGRGELECAGSRASSIADQRSE